MEKTPSDNDIKKIALLMAVTCVRNTIIESYHDKGKITNEEMMAFNKEVANKLYTFLNFFFNPNTKESEVFAEMMERSYPSNWDTPELDERMMNEVALKMGKKYGTQEVIDLV